MKLEKKKLGFLELFNMVSDTRSVIGDKIRVQAKDLKVTFSQFSHGAKVIHSIDIDTPDEFDVVWPIGQFYNLVKLLPDGSEITPDSLKSDDGGEYTFDKYNVSIPSPSEFLDIIAGDPIQEFTLKNIDQLAIARNFMGTEILETIALMSNHWVASDTILGCIIKTDNEIEGKLFLSRIIIETLLKNNVKEKEIGIYSAGDKGDFWFFEINGTKVIVPDQQFGLPDFFDSRFVIQYDHPYYCEINKEKLVNSLQRMQVVAHQNPNNRVYLNYGSGEVIIENKDHHKSKQQVSSVVQSEIKGLSNIVSCSNMIKLLNILAQGEDKTVYLHVCEDANDDLRNRCIKLEDSSHGIKLIHVLQNE